MQRALDHGNVRWKVQMCHVRVVCCNTKGGREAPSKKISVLSSVHSAEVEREKGYVEGAGLAPFLTCKRP